MYKLSKEEEFIKNFTDSIYDTDRIVIPKLNEFKINETKIIEGTIVSLESMWIRLNQNIQTLIQEFDTVSGFDLIVNSKKGKRAIANRVCWETDWNTFTIRKSVASGYETEIDKRMRETEEDYLSPHWTVQTYISQRRTGNLMSMGICKTKDLMRYIKEENAEDSVQKKDPWFCSQFT